MSSERSDARSATASGVGSRTVRSGSGPMPMRVELQLFKAELEEDMTRMFDDFAGRLRLQLTSAMREVIIDSKLVDGPSPRQSLLQRKATRESSMRCLDPTQTSPPDDFEAVNSGVAESRHLWTFAAKRASRQQRPPLVGLTSEFSSVPDSEGDDDAPDLANGTISGALLGSDSIPQIASNGARISKTFGGSGVQQTLGRFVRTAYYEIIIGALVVLSAVMIGVETDYRVHHAPSDIPAIFAFVETGLCAIFSLDIAARLAVRGLRFFTGTDWQWNTFDFLVVAFQIVERVVVLIQVETHFSTHFGLIRLVRFARVIRLFRVVRFFHELRSILASILMSLESLGWTLFLLLLALYVFSIFFTQVVHDCAIEDPPEALSYWYGSLFRTMLTLFESIAGGVSWDEAVAPLILHISPWLGVVFVVYIIVCVFALLNIVSAYFVVKATRAAQDDKDMTLASQIRDTFFDEDSSGITFDDFYTKLESREMREYFKAIDLDPAEARALFDLLDSSGKGVLTPDEVINGCLRLRGSAKALDLTRLFKRVEERLAKILRFYAPVPD